MNLRASFPRWRCFIPVNAAVLRLPSFSLASTKNTLRIFQAFRRELVFHIKSRPLAGDGMTAVPLRLKDNSFHSVRLNAASGRGLLLFRPRGSRRHCPHPRGALSACGALSLARMNPDVFSGHCLFVLYAAARFLSSLKGKAAVRRKARWSASARSRWAC